MTAPFDRLPALTSIFACLRQEYADTPGYDVHLTESPTRCGIAAHITRNGLLLRSFHPLQPGERLPHEFRRTTWSPVEWLLVDESDLSRVAGELAAGRFTPNVACYRSGQEGVRLSWPSLRQLG